MASDNQPGVRPSRQPRITLHLAGSRGQTQREPPDHARAESSIPPAVERTQQAGGEPQPSRSIVAVLLAVAGLTAAGITAYLVTRHGGSQHVGSAAPSSAHARSVSTPMQQAETWVTANVAANAPLCADVALAAQLAQSGFTAVSNCRSDGWVDKNQFVVSTPDIRVAIAGGLASAVRHRASFPVARFGTGGARIEVRMLLPAAQAALSVRMARATDERALADAALLHNPRVTTTASARTALHQGQLDIRAATLLALLAARTRVRVDAILIRAPEAAAGRPARSITVSVADPAALPATVRMLTDDYVPARVTQAGGGATRLDWRVGGEQV